MSEMQSNSWSPKATRRLEPADLRIYHDYKPFGLSGGMDFTYTIDVLLELSDRLVRDTRIPVEE